MADDRDDAHDILAAEGFVVPAPDPRLKANEARDILAAEEFGMPAPDPVLQDRKPRDVLAAEEFGMPAPDPVLKVVAAGSGMRVHLDPAGADRSEPARDVLAAEGYAMPGPEAHAVPPDFNEEPPLGAVGPRGRAALMAAVAGVLLVVRRSRRRSAD